MYVIKTVNVVATATLDPPPNFEDLIKAFPNYVLHDPTIYHCAYFKSKGIKGQVSLFSSGRMISVGTKSEEEAKYDLTFVAKALERGNSQNEGPTEDPKRRCNRRRGKRSRSR